LNTLPYLENGVNYVHNSEMSVFRRCRLKWRYAHRENLTPIIKPRPLYLGSVFHVGLEYHYKRMDAFKAMRLVVSADIQSVIESQLLQGFGLQTYIEEANHRLDLCTQVMENYVAFDKDFPVERDGKIPNIDGVPLIERTFEVPIDGMYFEGNPVMYRFTLDLGYEQNGGIWLVDHKTGKQFLDVRRLDLDTQLSLYVWALGQVVDQPVIGMEYNLIKMSVPREPELTKKGNRLSVAAIDTTWEIYHQAILRHGLDINDYLDMQQRLQHKQFFDRKHRYRTENELKVAERELRDTVTDMLDPNVKIYRNPTNDCAWDCPYREVCIMEFKGESAYDVEQYKKDNFIIGVNRRESFDHVEKLLNIESSNVKLQLP
jgi:hypothetical protein